MRETRASSIIVMTILLGLLTLQVKTTNAQQQKFSTPWFLTQESPLKEAAKKILAAPYVYGKTTPGSKIVAGESEAIADINGDYKLYPSAAVLLYQGTKVPMDIEGPLGGLTERIVNVIEPVEQNISEKALNSDLAEELLLSLNNPEALQENFPELVSTIELDPSLKMTFATSLIDPNPEFLPFLPMRCQYMTPSMSTLLFPGDNLLFNPPKWQDVDDALPAVRLEYDGLNVLKITHAKITRDYEDSGAGGFYANFHFGVVPYHPTIEVWKDQCESACEMKAGKMVCKLDTAEACKKLILIVSGHTKRDCTAEGAESHCEEEKQLTQQALDELYGSGVDSITVPRIHGFLMGPFYAHETAVAVMDKETGEVEEIFEGPQCEWGDTTNQIPEQEINYSNLGIWDWDYNVEYEDGDKKVHVIFWEADDNPMDGDVIDVVAVAKDETLESENPINIPAGENIEEINIEPDFWVTMVTGNTSFDPRSLRAGTVRGPSEALRSQKREEIRKKLGEFGLGPPKARPRELPRRKISPQRPVQKKSQ